MDPMSLIVSIVTVVGIIIGIVAGIVQVAEYLDKRREKKRAGQAVAAPPEKPAHSESSTLPRKTGLIGRESDVQKISEMIQADTPIVVIEGLGGIGKTALAISLANQWLESHFFQQVVWVSAKKRALNLSSLINEIAIGIDFPYISQLPPARQISEVSKIFRESAHLLVIDNFETIERDAKEGIFAFLSTLPAPSKALITSRPTLVGEDLIPVGASIYKLGGLDLKDSLALIQREGRRIGIAIDQGGSEALLSDLYQITGGNPLAIILAIGQVRHGKNSLEKVISNLQSARGNVFQEIFGGTWLLLGDLPRSLLMASSLFVGSFSMDALYATQEEGSDLEAAFSQLLQFALIESNNALTNDQLRFEIHPLTRAYAESRLDEFSGKREDFYLRLAKFYIQTSQRYEVRFWEGRDIYGPLEKERLNILAVMDWCWLAARYQYFAELARSIADFLNVRGDWQLCLTYGEQAIKAAALVADYDLQAWLLVHMHGYLHASRYEFKKAEQVLLEAIDLYRQTENKAGISETLRNLGRVYRKNGQIERAEAAAQESYQIALETQDKALITVALNELGKLARDKQDLAGSMRLFEQAAGYLGTKDNSIYAGILCNMAGVALDMGEPDLAEAYSLESLKFFSSIDNKEGLATTKWRLAEIEINRDVDRAESYARDAFDIFNRLGMQKECDELQKILGRAAQARERK